jgi:thiamine kinase-like enzyme
MHKLLEEYPLEGLPNVEYEMQILTYKMANYFKDEKVSQAMASKLNLKVASQIFKYYQVFHPAIKNLPERQVVHMDFVRGNILFLGSKDSLKISGVLDFEKAAVGHKTFDLARTLAFLYVDSKYKTKQSVFKIFMVSGYLRSGNGSCNKVTFSYKSKKYDLLESLVDFFMLYDFYKFLKHNPYESLGANEHYLRTVSFLIDRRVISSAG